jgi:hypothetical protein
MSHPFDQLAGHGLGPFQCREVPAVRYLDEPCALDAGGHLVGEMRRGQLILRPDQHQRRAVDRAEQGTRVRARHDRLLLFVAKIEDRQDADSGVGAKGGGKRAVKARLVRDDGNADLVKAFAAILLRYAR